MSKILKVLEPNTLGRDFIVGDLHGCFDQVQLFLSWIHFDGSKDRLFSVGDLVDRGPKNQECLRLLEKPWFHSVKGNHEDLMLDHLFGGPTNGWWIPNGGGWFVKMKHESKPQEFTETELKEFVKAKVLNLPLVITVPNHFTIVHAELNPGAVEGNITNEDLLSEDIVDILATEPCIDGLSATWERNIWYGLYAATDVTTEDVLKSSVDKFKNTWPIVSGHTPVTNPTIINNNLVNIDTMAFRIGKSPWNALTFFEPKSGKFWKVTDDVLEVTPRRLNYE